MIILKTIPIMRLRYVVMVLSAMLLISCEDTNVLVMTEAATDAVTAITLTDEDVQSIGLPRLRMGSTRWPRRKIPMTDAFKTLWQTITKGMDIPLISKCI